MKNFALIGKNIAYSFSPALHNTFFQTYGFNANYTLEDFLDREFNEFAWQELIKHYEGLNVTTPYKEKVISYLDRLDEVSMAVGAVNTIVVKNGKTTGFNTDYKGFLVLYDAIIQKTPQTAYILGTGGAAKVVHYALLNKGVQNIYYVTRHVSQENDTILSYEKFYALPKSDAILVNATPVGSKQYENQSPVTEDCLVGLDAVIDLIYTPAETLLLKSAKSKGIMCINGYDMLMGQAYEAEKIWWQDVSIEKSFFINYKMK